MASLQSVEVRLDPTRMGFYFDKYQYRITAHINGIEYFRYVHSPQEYYTRLEHSVAVYNHRPQDPVYWPIKDLISRYIHVLEKLFLWIGNTDSREYKRSISAGRITFYTNNAKILQELYDLCWINSVVCDVYRVDQPADFERGTIYHKEPKHSHRVYLAGRSWTHAEQMELRDFLADNNTNFFPSPSLHQWCHHKRLSMLRARYSYSTLFFDIDDEKYLVYFTLKFSNTVGKVCRIEKR